MSTRLLVKALVLCLVTIVYVVLRAEQTSADCERLYQCWTCEEISCAGEPTHWGCLDIVSQGTSTCTAIGQGCLVGGECFMQAQ